MLKNKTIGTVLTVWLLATLAATGQVRVTKSSGAAVGVDVSGVTATGPAAQRAHRTLVQNLNHSGWTEVATPGNVQVRGAITEAGGQVSFACTVVDAAGTVYVNATYTQPVAQAVHVAHQAAHDIVTRVTGQPTFFLARLVMIGVRGNAKELFLSDSSGQDIRQLTHDGSVAVKPRWSPDNRFIAYTSYLQRFPDVYTIDMTTGNRIREAAYPGLNSGGAISPDGRSMALILSKDGNPDLYVKDRVTGRLTRLTNTPRATEASPAWSPDGQRIVYVSDGPGTPHLYIISRNGGNPERLTFRGTQNSAPDWGANGLIAYQTRVGGRFQIAVIDPASKQERILTPPDADYEDPSWAPDGRHLAVARSVRHRSSIYLLDSQTSNLVALTGSGEWTAPAWSR